MEDSLFGPIQHAAEAIWDADILLVAVGAGFSADSGLPVYKDVANNPAYSERDLTYGDLCQPSLLSEDPETFLGFWAACFNQYADTVEHAGYHILSKWKTQLFSQDSPFGSKASKSVESQQSQVQGWIRHPANESGVAPPALPGCFFAYTSNVDAHLLRHFGPHEVYEIHGNIWRWQCASLYDENGRRKGSIPDLFRLPSEYRFSTLDHATMRVPLSGEALASSAAPPVPMCRCCGKYARPNILMFNDDEWLGNDDAERGYIIWEAAAEQMLKKYNGEAKMVILEIGCGVRVPSVRMECENVAADCPANTCTLIRINPDFPDLECDDEFPFIGIKEGALSALQQIDEILQSKMKAAASSASDSSSTIE